MKLTLANVDRLQQVAVSRLQIAAMAQIYELINKFSSQLTKELEKRAGADGVLSDSELPLLITYVNNEWTNTIASYTALLMSARVEAGNIAFGPYKYRHNREITKGVKRDLNESAYTPTTDDLEQLSRTWLQRRNYALRVAQERVLSDRLVLSQRIWRLNQDGLSQIRGILSQGMSQRTSAARLAVQLEQALGTNQDWPRWARKRLSQMDARQRLASKEGLYRSPADVPAGRSRGLSYNALRLARNEIQYANHAVTTEIASHSPWITGRKVRLSPAHPKVDICDEAAAGGPYPANSNFLPLHPQCMCRWEEVMMPFDRFVRGVKDWEAGRSDFLDPYVSWLNQRAVYPIPDRLPVSEAMEMFLAMQNWLDGNVDSVAIVITG